MGGVGQLFWEEEMGISRNWATTLMAGLGSVRPGVTFSVLMYVLNNELMLRLKL